MGTIGATNHEGIGKPPGKLSILLSIRLSASVADN